MVLSILGAVFAIAIALLARQRLLSLRYTIGWFFVAVALLAAGALTGVIDPLSDDLGVESTELLLGSALVLLLLIAVQLSITASGHAEMLRTMAESIALNEERLRRVEGDDEPAESGST
jgi:hypothetical protein